MIRAIATIPVLVPLMALAGACEGADDGSAGDTGDAGMCALSVEFDRRTYTAGGEITDPEQGRRLGTAAPISCQGQDADGPEEGDLVLYAIRGVSPRDAVLAHPTTGNPIVLVLEEDRSE